MSQKGWLSCCWCSGIWTVIDSDDDQNDDDGSPDDNSSTDACCFADCNEDDCWSVQVCAGDDDDDDNDRNDGDDDRKNDDKDRRRGCMTYRDKWDNFNWNCRVDESSDCRSDDSWTCMVDLSNPDFGAWAVCSEEDDSNDDSLCEREVSNWDWTCNNTWKSRDASHNTVIVLHENGDISGTSSWTSDRVASEFTTDNDDDKSRNSKSRRGARCWSGSWTTRRR